MATSPAPDAAAPPGMCPGIAVLGGGGAGGDGSGDGSGGEDGSGGNGNGKGDGGNGDGDGSGTCGNGDSSGCLNCGHNVAAGDPVDVVDGTVFTVPKTDLALPGFFAMDFRRSYSTARRDIDLGLGFGWTHGLAWTLEESDQQVRIITGDGRRVELPRPEDDDAAVVVGAWTIVRGQGFYSVRPGNEFEHFFEPIEPGSKRYRLQFIAYRDRGAIALFYEHGRLVRAVDTVGRTIRFHGNSEGRISAISVPDPQGRSITFAQYTHDQHGNLVSVIDANGHTTSYAYDEEHRLIRLQYPSGLVFHYVYDAQSRCIETWGEYPSQKDPALADGLSDLLADGRTKAKGIYHCRLEFSTDGQYTEVSDSVRLRRFFAGPNGEVAKAVNSLGGVTTRTFDKNGRVVAKIDANDGVWEYTYDARDKIVREVDPEGNAVQVTHDEEGNEIEVVDPMGGVTTIGRDEHGEIVWVKDAAGAMLEFRLGPKGLIREAIDTRGGRHLYEWDDQANCTARTFPNGARFQFEYDWWGRTVREIDPLGNEVHFTHDNTGKLTALTDPLGRTWTTQYDGMGNITVRTQPNGATTYRMYGGLNWLYRVQFPDGSEVRAGHNREGWPEYIENEHGERHEFKHNGEGLITWERNFHGHEYRFGYDVGGRLIWYDDGSGKREYTLSPVGRVLKEKAPDDTEREYSYNARGDLERAFSGSDGFEWVCDPLGRVTREILHVSGDRYEIESHRTVAGDRLACETSLGLKLQTERDSMGRVAAIWSGGERVLGIARNVLGQPVRRDLPEGGAVIDSYDAARRLRNRQVVSADAATLSVGEPEWVGGPRRGVIEQFYDYTPVDEVLKASSTDGKDIEYEYDLRRHLRSVKTTAGTQQYRADATGNVIELGTEAPPRVYGKGNQLLRFGDNEYRYDTRGFLVEKRSGAFGTAKQEVTRYEWNAWGLLQRVNMPDGTAIEFKYDPFARRLAKRTVHEGKVIEEHRYIWDLLSMVHEVDIAREEKRVHTYLFEDNDDSVPVGQREGEKWFHYINDVNGTPERIVDGAGRVVSRLERTPYGKTKVLAETGVTTPFRFPGQMEDEETGLHYNRYRYYDAEAGRYLSPDPIGIDGGFNLYEYGPNPIGWSDPMGWTHEMTVKTGDDGFLDYLKGSPKPGQPSGHTAKDIGKPTTYESTIKRNCPEHLKSQPRCHTEQKFAHDLVTYANNQRSGNLNGETYKLTGTFPPCPMCHNALRDAAGKTGATIKYSWNDKNGKKNTITYSGTSDPEFRGNEAQQLKKAEYNTWRENPKNKSGYSSKKTSWDKYYELMKGRS